MIREYEENEPNGEPDRPAEPKRGPKRVTFDDFQITRSVQQQQVDDERRAWKERQDRLEQQKPSLFRIGVPRLRSQSDDLVGEKKSKLSFFKRRREDEDHVEETMESSSPEAPPAEPYFADHERSGIRVVQRNKQSQTAQEDVDDRSLIEAYYKETQEFEDESDDAAEEQQEELDSEDYGDPEVDADSDTYAESEELEDSADLEEQDEIGKQEEELDREYEEEIVQGIDEDVYEPVSAEIANDDGAGYAAATVASYAPVAVSPEPSASQPSASQPSARERQREEEERLIQEVPLEPTVEPSLKAFLDSLRSFDSHPRRAHEPRDPRADFVLLLGELLDILREQVDATSAMFFWVNTKKQQLVLESAALDDRAYQYLAADKRFPIELDAVSRVVAKRKPELHSSILAQAELDLIPYYREPVGIASFAGMPVLFGDGLVAVLTVDSAMEDNFTQETLRILTNYSKLISGLIRSYIEKYDLLASARTLESARKLHQIVSPDTSMRVLREQRKNPEYILRALTEAASEIIDWDWLATASFDETRRIWSINSLQSKHSGAYVPPQTPISLGESIVGKCLSTGKSARLDQLTQHSIRYNVEEERGGSSGHSFMVIPIRTTNKNYGALAIEHSERNRFTDADVETLEHLARSAAAALEIIALSEMVGERALTDLLTGVLNKRGLLQRLNEELARAMEFDEPLTLVLFEIDGAAEFFARFAQEDSDTIVLALVRLLRFGSRAFDVIARVGEHTFAAVLVKTSDEEAYLWSEKMRKMIVSEVIAIGKRSFSVTVSVGVSGARRDGTVEELVEGAELAIERAKELNGNNVIVY